MRSTALLFKALTACEKAWIHAKKAWVIAIGTTKGPQTLANTLLLGNISKNLSSLYVDYVGAPCFTLDRFLIQGVFPCIRYILCDLERDCYTQRKSAIYIYKPDRTDNENVNFE